LSARVIGHLLVLLIAGLLGLLPGYTSATHGQGEPSARAVRVLVLRGHQVTYEEATRGFLAELEDEALRCEVIVLPKAPTSEDLKTLRDRIVASQADWVATAGSRATKLALGCVDRKRVLFFMVPNVLDSPFVRDASQQPRAGVAAGVSPERWVAWLRAWTPADQRVGLLASERAQRTATAIVRAGAEAGLKIRLIDAERDAFPDAIAQLNEQQCHGVLMIPDAHVYNGPNVKRLLLWGLRRHMPVWTFTQSIVEAGAFAGQYAEPQQVGEEAAELLLDLMKEPNPTAFTLRYPRSVSRSVNVRTAEVIEKSLENPTGMRGVVRLGEEP
jgi:ABC-type uncharacterized transport system substrate-binding protein